MWETERLEGEGLWERDADGLRVCELWVPTVGVGVAVDVGEGVPEGLRVVWDRLREGEGVPDREQVGDGGVSEVAGVADRLRVRDGEAVVEGVDSDGERGESVGVWDGGVADAVPPGDAVGVPDGEGPRVREGDRLGDGLDAVRERREGVSVVEGEGEDEAMGLQEVVGVEEPVLVRMQDGEREALMVDADGLEEWLQLVALGDLHVMDKEGEDVAVERVGVNDVDCVGMQVDEADRDSVGLTESETLMDCVEMVGDRVAVGDILIITEVVPVEEGVGVRDEVDERLSLCDVLTDPVDGVRVCDGVAASLGVADEEDVRLLVVDVEMEMDRLSLCNALRVLVGEGVREPDGLVDGVLDIPDNVAVEV